MKHHRLNEKAEGQACITWISKSRERYFIREDAAERKCNKWRRPEQVLKENFLVSGYAEFYERINYSKNEHLKDFVLYDDACQPDVSKRVRFYLFVSRSLKLSVGVVG